MPIADTRLDDRRRWLEPRAAQRPLDRILRKVSIAFLAGLGMMGSFALQSQAQISLSTAIDLAERNNPRVLGAQADVKRALAQLEATHDAYIPAINLGANFGQAYGYLPNPPTFFEVTAGSLVYSASQGDYTRSAHSGVTAANYALEDARETVAQDTAIAFISLDHDQQRSKALEEQFEDAQRLVTITQQRLDAGQDTGLGLTQAKLTSAKLHLAAMQAQDQVENDRGHLARLIGLPETSLRTDGSFPETVMPESPVSQPLHGYANAAVASAFANATAKEQQAKGDATFRFRPQINLVVNYNRYATFTESFKNLESTYKSNTGGTLLTANEAAFGVQISFPFLDRTRAAKARASAAEAARSRHDAESAQIEALDGQQQARHSIDELKVQSEVASLDQQVAQQQLDIVRQQMQSGSGNPDSPQTTPKEEQNARIAEREKYIAVIDATFQLRQAEIQLMRQTGQLLSWIKSGTAAPGTSPLPSAPTVDGVKP